MLLKSFTWMNTSLGAKRFGLFLGQQQFLYWRMLNDCVILRAGMRDYEINFWALCLIEEIEKQGIEKEVCNSWGDCWTLCSGTFEHKVKDAIIVG